MPSPTPLVPDQLELRYLGTEQCRALLEGAPLHLIDGGSRGGLFEPFRSLSEHVIATGFDPDPAASREGNVARALWSDSSGVRVHLAADRSTSSVYPPDERVLGLFPDAIGVPPRMTEEVVDVESISIDEAVGAGLCPRPDLVKLDIHSAEYEALEGAREALADAVVAVVVETWHVPIHRGQRLHGDIEVLLNGAGFQLFASHPVSDWPHALDGRRLAGDSRQLVGSESLFLRDLGDGEGTPVRTLVLSIAVAELYGYAAYAMRLTRRYGSTGALPADVAKRIEAELLRLQGERRSLRHGVPRLRHWARSVAAAIRGQSG